MPTYDYRCAACGHVIEIFHSIHDAPKKKCPACGKPKLERQIGAGAGFVFKGGGFYQTDYRSDSYKAGQKAEQDGGAKPDAKPDAKEGTKDAAKDGAAKTPQPEPKRAAKPSKAKDSTD